MKAIVRDILARVGVYVVRRRSLPRGIDWLWDIQRLVEGNTINTVFDVGANVGQTVIKIRKAFPTARVFAFEPINSTFGILQKNVHELINVRTYRLALSDSAAKGKMISEGDSQLSHLVGKSGVADVRRAMLEEVEITTVDRFCYENQIERIDVLKIDTEGADLDVLRGASEMLCSGKVDFVYIEVCFNQTDVTHSYFNAIDSYLVECGLRLNCIYEYGHLNRGRNLLFCNALFVSDNL